MVNDVEPPELVAVIVYVLVYSEIHFVVLFILPTAPEIIPVDVLKFNPEGNDLSHDHDVTTPLYDGTKLIA